MHTSATRDLLKSWVIMSAVAIWCTQTTWAQEAATVPSSISSPTAASVAEHGSDMLPDTRPLEWDEADLSTRLMDGVHRFVERKITESPTHRSALWKRDFSSVEAYIDSVAENREHLRSIMGSVDERLPPAMERYGDESDPALVAETAEYRVYQVRWPVVEGLWGCGLLVEPTSQAVGHVVMIPDADVTPRTTAGTRPWSSPGGRKVHGGWLKTGLKSLCR